MKFWFTGDANVKKFTLSPPSCFTSDLALARS